MHQKFSAIVITAVLGMCSASAGAGSETWPVTDGAVRDSDTALIVANAMWTSIYSSSLARLYDHNINTWRRKGCRATLREGVWHVDCPENEFGYRGGMSIELRQQDGALIDIILRPLPPPPLE
jgi:hypothetical protein